MTNDPLGHAVVVDRSGRRAACVALPSLEELGERKPVEVKRPADWRDAREVLREAGSGAPVLLIADSGLLTFTQLRLARRCRGQGRRVLVWCQSERTLEAMEGEDWLRVTVQWLVCKSHDAVVKPVRGLRRVQQEARFESRQNRGRAGALVRVLKEGASRILDAVGGVLTGDLAAVQRLLPDLGLASVRRALGEALGGTKAAELPLPGADGDRLPPHGVYVRLDWWNAISSGGSYGHTCFVAAELAKRSKGFACLMANRFQLLDELGIRQYRLEPPFEAWGESQVAGATEASLHALRAAFLLVRPGFVYERLVVGNFAAAKVCQELEIPYVVEYNGSESSMMRSFGGRAYRQEALYLEAERLAFAQAALISVVSDPIRKGLVEQGVPAEKIIVNPNGVDPDYYAPATAEERGSIRRELGWGEEEFVVGFTGTFGGWHGIDDLAQILPRVCKEEPRVRFLLIGDGSYRHLIDRAIAEHGLGSKVVCTGRVPQQQGARLLRACDAFVSPHNSHMVDSRFFGSPTKLFEYMAVGGAIVASDLEQIGEVLRPALGPAEVSAGAARVQVERAVLCRPGDVQAFVDALVGLARNPALVRALGRTARQAAVDEFSWARHVERLAFALGGAGGKASWEPVPNRETGGNRQTLGSDGDAHKWEAQDQGNGDAEGPHSTDSAETGTLESFRAIEAHRYGVYAPWLRDVMKFETHRGEDVLELGGGVGTDLAQFARAGCRVTDIDHSAGHLALAQQNFELRGLSGTFVHSDAEALPFGDESFDLVYSVGEIHHSPNTVKIVEEMWRVLRPGGNVIAMVYAQRSLHYWLHLFWSLGVRQGLLERMSMGKLMSQEMERNGSGEHLRVKVYTRSRLRRLFRRFEGVEILQRQGTPKERDAGLRWADANWLARFLGWDLVVKARKPWVA